jgi:hypothetical protein
VQGKQARQASTLGYDTYVGRSTGCVWVWGFSLFSTSSTVIDASACRNAGWSGVLES